jgi:RNA ligase (TIGR02306 family)
MSDYRVPYTTILEVLPHQNADRLSIYRVYGFYVVGQKDKYKVNDKIIFIPPDSVISEELEKLLFSEGSKIRLNNRRVKQIRIRSFPSNGMLIDPEEVKHIVNTSNIVLETDLGESLGVTKYEPPTPSFQRTPTGAKLRDKPLTNPYFRAYNGVDNVKWYPDLFKDGEEVIIQIKLHGSHIRFAKAPFVANTLWKKVLKFFKLTPKFESVWGSNKVELTNRTNHTGYYGSDIYSAAIEKLKCFNKIKDGEFVHAELIGPGIQKGYTYGHKEHHIVIFDVRTLQPDGTQKWLNPEEAETFAKERGFDFVPVLYRGPFNKELLIEHTSGPDAYCSDEKIREGCVIKSRYDYDLFGNKKALKSINPDYLDGDHGDNH